MSAPHTANVLYTSDTKFNMDYYLSSHMPMVLEKLKPHGMVGYRVTKLGANADGSDAAFGVLCQLSFKSAEGMPKGFAAEFDAIKADIANFADKAPQIITGEIVGTVGV